MGFCALFEVNHGILCIFRRSSWDFVHFWKFLVGLCIFESSSWDCVHFGSSSRDLVHYSKSIMGFCAFLKDPHRILCIFGSSSYHFVHFWKFLMGFYAVVEFPHGKAYTCPFHPFTFSLQNTCFCNMYTDWLRQSLAATSSKHHPVITNILVTRPTLMRRRRIVTFFWRRCPSLGLSQIIFIWYDFSHIYYFSNFYCK
jgi:hypothetical protein